LCSIDSVAAVSDRRKCPAPALRERRYSAVSRRIPRADTADAVERILGRIIVNIMLYHLFLDRSGIALGNGISIAALFLLWVYRYKFPAIFRP
jgi:hypothetical protein